MNDQVCQTCKLLDCDAIVTAPLSAAGIEGRIVILSLPPMRHTPMSPNQARVLAAQLRTAADVADQIAGAPL